MTGETVIILSAFDGISCARVALVRAGIPITKYYASEVDKPALQIAMKNFPDTIQLGDIRQITRATIPEEVDFLIGGSPCQDLSVAKIGRQGLEGQRSSLFFEFLRLRNELKPRWFVLENVASMRKADAEKITRALFNCSGEDWERIE